MATLTQVTLTCDVCGQAEDVRTRTIGLDGKTYEIDLCPQDSERLSRAAASYASKARTVTGRHSPRPSRHRPRSRADTAAAQATGSQQEKGVYVYGILPADVDLAAEIPGVGESPGLLQVVRSGALAALISEVDLSGRLGSPDDLRTHMEILDATATEVPVLPLRFGAVLTSEEAVAEELLAAHHDEFADALERLDGRAEFVVKGRYLEEPVLREVLSENKQATRLRDDIRGQDPDVTRDARIELGEIISEAVAAKREEDTRVLGQAMDSHCVASAVREPTDEVDAVHMAFLVEADRESDVERVIEGLARDWAGRIEVQLLGPMAAYDFVGTAKAEG